MAKATFTDSDIHTEREERCTTALRCLARLLARQAAHELLADRPADAVDEADDDKA